MSQSTNPVEDETLHHVLQELSDSSWSMGLQGASQNELADERLNRMTVAKAKTELLAWHSQGVGEVKEHEPFISYEKHVDDFQYACACTFRSDRKPPTVYEGQRLVKWWLNEDGEVVLLNVTQLHTEPDGAAATPTPQLTEVRECPKCHRHFVPNPARKGMSCLVQHAEGSCCHYSQTEVATPQLDPFDFVGQCRPGCEGEQHAYHLGQSDMARRMAARLHGSTPQPAVGDEELREQIYKASLTPFNDIYYVPPGVDGSWGLAGKNADKMVELIANLLAQATERAREQDVIDWLSKQDIVKVQKFFAIIMYRYIMQPTNATKVDIKLDGFSQDAKVLGDFEITARLRTRTPLEGDGKS